MKLKELVARVDKSERNTCEAGIEEFAQLFNQYVSWDTRFGERVKKHWIYNWLCTDTWVGLAAYYMDGEPVAVSWQNARKNDEEIQFISKECATKVRNFVMELIAPEETSVSYADMEEDLGQGYTVSYGSQLLKDECTYQGQQVKVVYRYDSYSEIDKWGQVDVLMASGDIRTVALTELEFAYHLADEPAPSLATPMMSM